MAIEPGGFIGPTQAELIEGHRRNDAQRDVAIAGQWGITLAVVLGVAAGALDIVRKNRVRGLAFAGTVFVAGIVVNKELCNFIGRSDAKQKWLNRQQ
jgi:hypothetical protein